MAACLGLDSSYFYYVESECDMQINVVVLEIATKYQIELEIEHPYVYGVETAGPIFAKEIGRANIEKVAVLCLDHTNKIINFAIVSMGNDEDVNMSMSQLFRFVLLSNASKIIVGHNHPSGVLEITKPDISITKKIGQIASLLGIRLIDSVIVNACGNSVSIRENIGDQKNEE